MRQIKYAAKNKITKTFFLEINHCNMTRDWALEDDTNLLNLKCLMVKGILTIVNKYLRTRHPSHIMFRSESISIKPGINLTPKTTRTFGEDPSVRIGTQVRKSKCLLM